MTMPCGLFGKLGARRDFIALATPRRFLEIWEPWIQGCMSASQHQLGAGWQNAFLTAPLWRFWLGADLAGTTVLGVFMPSVDGVGRYYPLTLLAVAEPAQAIPPPDLDAQEQWFGPAEDFLLATLDRTRSFEDISAALEALAPPAMEGLACRSGAVLRLGETMVGAITAGMTFQSALETLRQNNHATSAAASFWWTEGGAEFPPMALAVRGLPDPFHYSRMLIGKLSDQAARGG
jgi:type VI secretion system protein ImpM